MKVFILALVLLFFSASMAESNSDQNSESETVSPLSWCKLTSTCDSD